MPVCSFCGESFAEGRLACPHCGSDAETGWADDAVDIPQPEMDDDDYTQFLADEGLGPPRPPASQLANRWKWALLMALLAAASISGVLWLLV